MPQRVQAPDGSIVEFPDGMTDDQIAGVMRREYGGPDNRETSQSLGFMKGVARPFENFAKVNPLNVFDTAQARDTREAARQGMNNYFAEREATQRPGMIGEIAGQVVGTLPIAGVTRNPFVAGGLQGAALTDAKTPMGVAGDAAMGAGLNWLGGKVMDAAADVIKPAIAPAVRRMSDAGVKMTPGMVKGGKAMVREDKMMSRPVVGDAIAAGRQKAQSTFNTASVNEALKPLGVQVPKSAAPGFDSVAAAKKIIGAEYDRVVPNLTVQINGQQFAQNIAPVARNLKPAEQKQLRQIVSNELGNGQLSGEALKRAQGELRRLAGVYSRSQNANEQLLGNALNAVDDELTGAMLAQNPQWAPQLQKVNTAYRGYRIIADAAGRADDGVFNTGQLKQSVRRGDFSKSKDASGRGEAFMQRFSNDARKVLPAKTPDSGTAGRMQAGNIFANIKGAADTVSYNIDDALQRFRLAPRPAGARKAARRVRRLKGPAGAAAVATTAGGSRE
jgi:hypothetical protein